MLGLVAMTLCGCGPSAGFTIDQRTKDPDFYAKNYVHRGLGLIASQCDALLK